MKMTAADQSAYPKMAYYVKNDLPQVANNTTIANAMKRIGGMDLKTLKDALAFGRGPEIKIVAALGACGEFTPNDSSQELRVAKRLVQDFEAGKGKAKTSSGKQVYVLGATLLHELVHWGDDQNGKDRAGEEGNEFENAVYGMVIPC